MENRKKANDQPYADNITNIDDNNEVENIDEIKENIKIPQQQKQKEKQQ